MRETRWSDQARRKVEFTLPEPLARKIEAAAKEKGQTFPAYCRILMEAAWSARCAPTGDRDLDATVSAVLILHGSGMDFDAIGRALKVDDAVVDKIVGAWFAFQEAA